MDFHTAPVVNDTHPMPTVRKPRRWLMLAAFLGTSSIQMWMLAALPSTLELLIWLFVNLSMSASLYGVRGAMLERIENGERFERSLKLFKVVMFVLTCSLVLYGIVASDSKGSTHAGSPRASTGETATVPTLPTALPPLPLSPPTTETTVSFIDPTPAPLPSSPDRPTTTFQVTADAPEPTIPPTSEDPTPEPTPDPIPEVQDPDPSSELIEIPEQVDQDPGTTVDPPVDGGDSQDGVVAPPE